MKTFLLFVLLQSAPSNSYTIGAILALAILGYLVYALLKPEKF